MFKRTTHQWRFLSCLAIFVSLIGSLQQCHAFCYLTSCEVASIATHEGSDCRGACTCSECACHHHETKANASQDERALAGHQESPCQSDCWCCHPANPLTVSSDATESAKKQLASNDFVSAGVIVGSFIEPEISPAWDISFRESDSLTAAEFCVQLCRFRI
jgi:hypothetical protein